MAISSRVQKKGFTEKVFGSQLKNLIYERSSSLEASNRESRKAHDSFLGPHLLFLLLCSLSSLLFCLVHCLTPSLDFQSPFHKLFLFIKEWAMNLTGQEALPTHTWENSHVPEAWITQNLYSVMEQNGLWHSSPTLSFNTLCNTPGICHWGNWWWVTPAPQWPQQQLLNGHNPSTTQGAPLLSSSLPTILQGIKKHLHFAGTQVWGAEGRSYNQSTAELGSEPQSDPRL